MTLFAPLGFSAGGLALRAQLPYTPPAAAEGSAPQDPSAKTQEMRARGKALVQRRRQKQLEEKEGKLMVLLQAQAQVRGQGLRGG